MSWGGVISLICIFLVCVALTGCVQSRPDGWCAVAVEGVCVSRWHKGEKVPSGEIDMRYVGASCSNGGAIDEKAYNERDMETQGDWSKYDFISRGVHCGGSVTTTGKEW